MVRAVAILETMWDWESMTSEAGYAEAPRYFRINPRNYTGGRLYKLLGPGVRLLVTNACRDLVDHAKKHGTPDPVWLSENLQILDGCRGYKDIASGYGPAGIDLLLVCGKVAQRTYRDCGYVPKCQVIEIPHPAARGYWKKETIASTANEIQMAVKAMEVAA